MLPSASQATSVGRIESRRVPRPPVRPDRRGRRGPPPRRTRPRRHAPGRRAAPAVPAARPTRSVERLRLAPDRHDDAAVGIELDDHVRAFVHHPDVVLAIDAYRVGEDEPVALLADLADELARRSNSNRRAPPRSNVRPCRSWPRGSRCACRRRCCPSSWWPRPPTSPRYGCRAA